jgi:hypothetical protein
MVAGKSLICPTTKVISPIAVTAPAVSGWMVLTRSEMSSMARGRLVGQVLDLAGNDGEALARFSGARPRSRH